MKRHRQGDTDDRANQAANGAPCRARPIASVDLAGVEKPRYTRDEHTSKLGVVVGHPAEMPDDRIGHLQRGSNDNGGAQGSSFNHVTFIIQSTTSWRRAGALAGCGERALAPLLHFPIRETTVVPYPAVA